MAFGTPDINTNRHFIGNLQVRVVLVTGVDRIDVCVCYMNVLSNAFQQGNESISSISGVHKNGVEYFLHSANYQETRCS